MRRSSNYAGMVSLLLAAACVMSMLTMRQPRELLVAAQPLVLDLRIEIPTPPPPPPLPREERRIFAEDAPFSAADVVREQTPPPPKPVVEELPPEPAKPEPPKPEPKPKPKPKPLAKQAPAVKREAKAQAGVAGAAAAPEAAQVEVTATSKSLALGVLLSEVEKHKKYPRQARRIGAQGTVTLLVGIDAQGRVVSCSVAKSSGVALLDQESARLGQKLLGLDTGVKGAAFAVRVPIRYSLE